MGVAVGDDCLCCGGVFRRETNFLDTPRGSAILTGRRSGGRLSYPSRISSGFLVGGDQDVPKSVLEAIKQGQWDFEPEIIEERRFDATRAMPGTDEKLEVLAARVRAGLPLWHGHDRTDLDDLEA